jgi:hypothetical protein
MAAGVTDRLWEMGGWMRLELNRSVPLVHYSRFANRISGRLLRSRHSAEQRPRASQHLCH